MTPGALVCVRVRGYRALNRARRLRATTSRESTGAASSAAAMTSASPIPSRATSASGSHGLSSPLTVGTGLVGRLDQAVTAPTRGCG